MYTDLRLRFDNFKPITENALSAVKSFQIIHKDDLERTGLNFIRGGNFRKAAHCLEQCADEAWKNYEISRAEKIYKKILSYTDNNVRIYHIIRIHILYY